MKSSAPMVDRTKPEYLSLPWLSLLLQTTDSAYPIGGFAHSGGLEGMVGRDHVRSEKELRRFLQNEIADSLANVDLPLLYQAWLAATAEDTDLLCVLDQVAEATRFSTEQRQASRRLGTQRWSLLKKLHFRQLGEEPHTWLGDLDQALPNKHLSLIAGIEAVVHEVPASAAMTAFSHQTVMMVAQAAMKIMRIGQTSVQTLVTEMAGRYPQLITHAQNLDTHDIGACMPMFDIAAAWHESAPARMFLS